MGFWPRAVLPGQDRELTVQLSRPEQSPVGALECGSDLVDLGGAIWSHPIGLVHTFALPELPYRVGTECRVTVTGDGVVYEPADPIEIRGGRDAVAVKALLPDQTRVDEESIVEILGGYFSRVVVVTWVSTGDYTTAHRSARVERGTPDDRVVLPFAPGLSRLGAGEYLVVVENRDRSAGIYPGVVLVKPLGEPEVVEVQLVGTESSPRLLVAGQHLEEIRRASIRLPAGVLPLMVSSLEGTEMPTLCISLPPHAAGALRTVPDVLLKDGEVLVLPAEASALSTSQPSL
jgi:hypothetical protein